MYSGDVPAILSARKTYSFSRNRIHPPGYHHPPRHPHQRSQFPLPSTGIATTHVFVQPSHPLRFRPPLTLSLSLSLSLPPRPTPLFTPLGLRATLEDDDDDGSFFVSFCPVEPRGAFLFVPRFVASRERELISSRNLGVVVVTGEY